MILVEQSIGGRAHVPGPQIQPTVDASERGADPIDSNAPDLAGLDRAEVVDRNLGLSRELLLCLPGAPAQLAQQEPELFVVLGLGHRHKVWPG